MKKCVVVAKSISLVVEEGSEVIVSDRQYEVARAYLKPCESVKEEKKVEKKVKKK